jgi:outer membrane protein insertion porin family
VFHAAWRRWVSVPFLISFIFIVRSDEVQKRANGELSLSINLSSDTYEKDLEAWLSEPLVIETVTYKSDVTLQDDEFHYLLDIDDHTIITVDDLKRALSNFKKKNSFKIITLVLQPAPQGKKILHLQLEGLWTFRNVIFEGPMLGKEIFRQYYLLEPSEIFDIEKHNHFIAMIKQVLHDEGYCKAFVADYLTYDQALKSVSVHCVIDPGAKFVINTVEVFKSDRAASYEQDNAYMLQKIAKRMCSRLQNIRYTHQIVEYESQQLKEYLIRKGFLNASLEIKKEVNLKRATLNLTFLVSLDQKKLFSFVGNTFFSGKELFNFLLVFEGSTSLLPPSLLIEELMQAYRKKGFWFVSIALEQLNSTHCFMITEGSRVSISEIFLKGIDNFDQDILLKKFFSGVKKSKYFDADTLKDALNNLVLFYIQEGFWDCKVLKQDYVPLGKTGSYRLDVTLDEGKRRYLASVSIPDFPELMQEGPFFTLQSALPLAFDAQMIHVQRQWLIHYFQQQGYLYVEVKPELKQEDNALILRWVIDLKEGPVTFGKTIVTGPCSFPIKNILRELHYKQGDLWDKRRIDQSVLSLRKLGIFESVYLHPHAITESESQKTIMVKLLEDDPFEIRVRAGFQQVSKNLTFRSGTTYKVGGSFLYKNPGNVADYILIDGDVTRFYRYFSAMYFRPWIFDRPINMVLKGYNNKYTQPVRIGTDRPLYQATQEGALIGLRYPVGRSEVGTNLGFELMETRGISYDLARAINFEPGLVDCKVPYFFVEPMIFIDLLDDKLNPTRGSLTILSCKGMFSWKKGSVNFFKMLYEQSFFVPFDPCVLGIRFRFGHIFNQRLSSIMPPERFYLGGPNSLRGYEIDQAPPLGIFIDDHGKRCLVAQGGKSMFNGNVELRIPLYNALGATLFQDIGVLIENSLAEISGNKLLAATGFGLRYNTPIGPLRFDLGWKWKRRKREESSYAWFLTLGNAF